MRFFCLALGFFVSLSASAEWMTVEDRDALWAEGIQQLSRHPRLVYHDGSKSLPDYPGFITSNESTAWTMRPPPGPPGMQVGFGSVVNFNLLAARRSSSFVAADQSPEVTVAMMSFWRPLFLASESPAELLARSGGYEYRRETVDGMFKAIAQGKKGSEKGLAQLETKLQQLVKDRKISSFDMKFTLAVVKDQIPNPNADGMDVVKLTPSGLFTVTREKPVFAFRASKNHAQIPLALYDLYASPAARKQTAVSFLEKDGFNHVRTTMAEGRDHYAVGKVEDPKLWKAVGDTAKARKESVSDVYLSNIPALARARDAGFDAHVVKSLGSLPSVRLTVYEAQVDTTQPFTTQTMERGPDGQFHAVAPPLQSASDDAGSTCPAFLRWVFRW